MRSQSRDERILRLARKAATKYVNWLKKRLPKQTDKAKKICYAWLADNMGLSPKDLQIRRFTLEQCEDVLQLCWLVKIGALPGPTLEKQPKWYSRRR